MPAEITDKMRRAVQQAANILQATFVIVYDRERQTYVGWKKDQLHDFAKGRAAVIEEFTPTCRYEVAPNTREESYDEAARRAGAATLIGAPCSR